MNLVVSELAHPYTAVASTCTIITLVGLAIGFVLLRVESAVEGTD